jgi:hypothetical protein
VPLRHDRLDAAQQRQESGYGQYTEIKVEKVLLDKTSFVPISPLLELHEATDCESLCTNRKAKRSVVHFFHPDFRRCKIMDKHLEVNSSPLSDGLRVIRLRSRALSYCSD